MVLKHTEDDGDLSIFAADDEILIACQKGHFWIVAATKQTFQEKLADRATLESVGAKFGQAAERFLMH